MTYQGRYLGWIVLSALLCGLGCGGDKKSTGGTADAGVAAKPVACGSKQCTVTADDAMWGGQACCLDTPSGACGIKADSPMVSDVNGNQIPLSAALKSLMEADGGSLIVNTHPKIPCLPKNTPGTKSAKCPAESLDGKMVNAGEDAGADSYVVQGCCGPDGMCGFIDDTTGFGCVKTSQSLVGQVLGLKDKACD